ncbi:MAG TPA: TetR/AcrR family transcriptional regulator [Jatrophihabitantaceae bacterium]
MTDQETSIRPLRKDVVRNRELLLRAAYEVFAERGVAATLDDVARHAGLGVGTAYRHFANKHQLVTAVVQEAFQDLITEGQRCLALDDPWQAITDFSTYAMSMQGQNRGLRDVFNSVPTWDQLEAERDLLTGLLDEIFHQAREAGVVREDAVATDFGLILHMLSALTDLTSDENPQLWRRYLPMLLDGLRPGGTPLPVAPLSVDQLTRAMSEHGACA